MMDEQLKVLLNEARRREATDIHLTCRNHILEIQFRTTGGLQKLNQTMFDEKLLEYLKFLSGMDLCRQYSPQSGSFEISEGDHHYSCRFSLMNSRNLSTGVIRLLESGRNLTIRELSSNPESSRYLESLVHLNHGLVVSAGPTGSGKTTTLHAILHEMAVSQKRKIISLEDPIEIPDSGYVQMEVNARQGFTYERGLEEILRHDPDVILIGECRSPEVAHCAIRAGLTGHLVFMSVHAGSGAETVSRMMEFGIPEEDLKVVLKAVFAQRLCLKKDGKGRECVYEKWNTKQIADAFEKGDFSAHPRPLDWEIRHAIEKGWIEDGSWKMA